ncbi:acyl-CoA dehydrogenase family protein [Nocardia sp. NPDC050378]|uniref:acyl-CoA dehydrogenase family protein n=1 Tax=Nocardia sp. NPDC050378 TaxID=3155400 RepID=UPI0033FA4A94
MTVDSGLDAAELALLTEAVRRTMTEHTGAALTAALVDLGWPEILTEAPELAGPVFFRILGDTGAHAPLLLDVIDRDGAVGLVLPFAGGRWVRWDRDGVGGPSLDSDLPLHAMPDGSALSDRDLADGRRLLGWWLLGTGHAMLALARTHAVERTQFGRPLASFQAVRHRLAETLVALNGAEAALLVADDAGQDVPTAGHIGPGGVGSAAASDTSNTTGAATLGGPGPDPVAEDQVLAAMLAKAAAGQAALTAARHCQQVLGGIGFTAEHPLHRHVRRAVVLDGLLGSSRELTRAIGESIRLSGNAIRIANL